VGVHAKIIEEKASKYIGFTRRESSLNVTVVKILDFFS
jgi:hypothetical protein